MLNKNIEFAIKSCKEILLKEIKENLEESGGKVEINYKLTEDETIKSLFLREFLGDNEIMVEREHNGETEVDYLDELYSLDEIINIIGEL